MTLRQIRIGEMNDSVKLFYKCACRLSETSLITLLMTTIHIAIFSGSAHLQLITAEQILFAIISAHNRLTPH